MTLFWRLVRLSVLVSVVGALLVSTPASAAAKKTINPCSLLTKSQLAPILGVPIAHVSRQGMICTFATAPVGGKTGSFAEAQVVEPYTSADFHSDYLAADRDADNYQRVNGVGTLAVIQAARSEIDVLKGTALISLTIDVLNSSGISVPVSPAILKKLGETAVHKL